MNKNYLASLICICVQFFLHGVAMAQGYESKIENWALYSQSMSVFPEKQIEEAAHTEKYYVSDSQSGLKTYHYEWPDLKVIVNIMPKPKIEKHIQGFLGYIDHLSSLSSIKPNNSIIKRVSGTSMVVAVIIEPGGDMTGRSQNIVGAIAHFTKAIMFTSGVLFDENGEELIGP